MFRNRPTYVQKLKDDFRAAVEASVSGERWQIGLIQGGKCIYPARPCSRRCSVHQSTHQVAQKRARANSHGSRAIANWVHLGALTPDWCKQRGLILQRKMDGRQSASCVVLYALSSVKTSSTPCVLCIDLCVTSNQQSSSVMLWVTLSYYMHNTTTTPMLRVYVMFVAPQQTPGCPAHRTPLQPCRVL